MITEQQVEEIIVNALNQINEEREADEKINVSPQTKLFGVDAELDSLGLVTVVSDVETQITDATGKPVSLMDDRAMTRPVSPFTDVQTLKTYICEIIK